MVSGAQLLLRLGQLSRGEQTGSKTSLHIVPQYPLPGLGLPEGAQPLFSQQTASLALALSRAAEPPQGVSPVPAGLPGSKKAAVHPAAAQLVQRAAPGTAVPPVQQVLHPLAHLIPAPGLRKFQLVQHSLLPGALPVELVQSPCPPAPPQALPLIPVLGRGKPGQSLSGIVPAQRLESGARLLPPQGETSLQPHPQQVAVQRSPGAALKGAQQGLQSLLPPLPLGQAHDGIEVHRRLSIRPYGPVPGVQLVVPRSVPHLVVCPARLHLPAVHLSPPSAGPGMLPGGYGRRSHRRPAAARRGQRPCSPAPAPEPARR